MIIQIVQILYILLQINIVCSRHFRGGTITYKVIQTSGSTVFIQITQTYLYTWPLIYCDDARIWSQSTPNMSSFSEYYYHLNCISNCTTSGDYQPVPVRTYCTDYSAAMTISVAQRMDIVNLTSGAYFKVAFASGAWRSLSLPTPSSSSYNWSISCIIDLRTRSDTGKINTPPVVTMISPIYVPFGIRTALIIPTIDGDHDEVRCRFSNSTDECASICPPASLPNNTILISSNCTLLITGAKVGDWYAVALQVEDFADSSSTIPLNSVSVQFLINVYAMPNCTIAPLLYGPSKQTGTCQSLEVGQTYTVILYAENYCSGYGVTIKDIATLSFPIVYKTNITQNTSTLYSISLTWTPTTDNVGSQILCAIAIDSQNVQSNQYCLTFAISENDTVTCSKNEMETTILLETTMDDTTEMATVTTTSSSTTTIQSSTILTWILPLVSILASLILLLCCICVCCPQPYDFGLFYTKWNEHKSLESSFNPAVFRRPPRLYMIRKISRQDSYNDYERNTSFDRSSDLISIQNYSNRFPVTFRNNIHRTRKNLVWISPSSQPDKINLYDTDISSLTRKTSSNQRLDSFSLTARNRMNKAEKNIVWVQPSSALESISTRSSYSDSVRTITESDIKLRSCSTTPRNSMEKIIKKHIVGVYSPP